MKEKLNIVYWQQRWGKLPVTGVIVAFLLLLVWIGYGLGNWRVHYLEDQADHHQQRINTLYNEIERLEYQQHILRVELDIEKAANTSLQQEMAMAQDENFALRRDITFYQKIMAPELEAEGVIIESLELKPNFTPGHFHFSLALVQLERQRSAVNGDVSITLSGRLNGDQQSYNLLDLAHMPDNERSFSMRYFTVLAGDFMVPENFVPERIDVRVQLSRGNQRILENSFFWSRLLQRPQESELDQLGLDDNT
ncbi:MAG: DUF6776 family protein [Idiomarina sp.]